MSQVPPSPGPIEPGNAPQEDDRRGLTAADEAPVTQGVDPAESERAAARKDRVIGLVIVALGFCLALMISWWSTVKSRPLTSQPPAPATTAGLAGFPASVDPLQALDVARGLTDRSLLREISIEGVGPAGTVEVRGDSGRVRYTFQDPPGEGAQPPRDGRTLARRHYCGRQTVQITPQGIGAEPDVAGASCQNPPVEALPDPRCGPREVWQVALRRGVKADRLARVEYYRAAAGPAWRFTSLGGPPATFTVHGDCVRELPSAEARSLPH